MSIKRDIYKCGKCTVTFDFPRIVKPDAGFSNPTDIVHRHKIEPVKMCPECGCTNIRSQ